MTFDPVEQPVPAYDDVLSEATADRVGPAGSVDFDTWVTARGPELLRFGYLVLGDRLRAEEAVQEALALACGRWQRVSAASDPGAYVRRMIVNADISWWRKFRRREDPVAEPADERTARAPERAAREPYGDPAATVTETDAMWRLCATLPRRQRAAVVLRYYEGCPDAEIARVLGCTESTVRSQIHRALATLRARLTDEEGRDG